MNDGPTTAAQPSYEAATARLEAIIRRLDSGEAGLRETLDLVRRAAASSSSARPSSTRSAAGSRSCASTSSSRASRAARRREPVGAPRRAAAARSRTTRSSRCSATSRATSRARRTVIRLRGGGAGGRRRGRHLRRPPTTTRSRQAGPVQPLAGDWTLGSFCDARRGPRPVAARRRRARPRVQLPPLGLRVGGAGPRAAPGRHVAARRRSGASRGRSASSSRCASATRRRWRRCARAWTATRRLRFKLDPTSDWTDELVAELVATGAVDSVDLKGLYEGTIVDQPADPALYRRVVEAFPEAWIEDPRLTPETEPVLAPHRDRITWDANIHSVADIEALPFPPRMVNVKPSRLGPLRDAPARLRALRGARHRHVRRRPVRARPRPRADPVPRVALPPRHAQRRRARAATTTPTRRRAADLAARAAGRRDGLPLGGLDRALAGFGRSRHQSGTNSASPSSWGPNARVKEVVGVGA